MMTHNVEVFVVTPDRNGVYGELKNMGINVIALQYSFNVRPRRLRAWLACPVRKAINYISSLRLTHYAHKHKIDLIHSNTSVNNVGYKAAKRLDIPHVWHIREYGMEDFGLNILKLNERLHEEGNYSIAITKDIADSRGVLGLASSRVIYNGIVNQVCKNFSTEREDYFLFAGRLEPTKGLDDLVKAFINYRRLLSSSNTRLLIAGAETPNGKALVSEIKAEIQAAGFASDVEWLGERKDVTQLMQRAKAIIIPSRFEGFGRVMPEAMAVGCLTIARDTGGTHEQLENGLSVTGKEISLRFTTVNELTERLIQVDGMSKQTVEGYRNRAAQTVEVLYTNDSYGAQVLAFYTEILTK